MTTCLFTGEVLTPTTRLEHTIPEGLCGRITSRECTSDTFNNDASPLDAELVARYEVVRSRLAPLLSAAHRPGRANWIGVNTGQPYKLDRLGHREIARPIIASRREDGRPAVTIASRPHRLGDEEPVSVEGKWVDLIEPIRTPEAAQIVGPGVELAMLKSFVATWDVLLDDQPDRFTRGAEMKACRSLVRDAIRDIRTLAVDRVRAHCLGFTFDTRLIEFMAAARAPIQPARMPFEHVLMVWSHSPTHTLNGAWREFDFDVMAFRLSTAWRGPDVAWCAGQGVLSGSTAFGPTAIPTLANAPVPGTGLGAASSSPHDRAFAEGCFEQVGNVLYEAAADAQVYVELHAGGELLKSLLAGPKFHTVRQTICRRIGHLYSGRAPELREALENACEKADQVALDARLTEVEHGPLERVYREVFQRVLERAGKPVVVESSEAEMTPWRT